MPVELTTAITAIKAYRASAKAIDWVNKSPLDAAIQEAGAKANREMTQVCFAVVRALIAVRLGRDPNEEEVQAYMLAAIDDPSFPARTYRLFGEGRKSTSDRRRRLLASVLFGMPFSKVPADDVDRLDMVFERMMPGDARLLMRLSDLAKTPLLPDSQMIEPVSDEEKRPATCEVFALRSDTALRIITSNDYPKDRTFNDDFLEQSRLLENAIELDALEVLGCVSVGEQNGTLKHSSGYHGFYRLLLTPVGELVVKALVEVRAGFEPSITPKP